MTGNGVFAAEVIYRGQDFVLEKEGTDVFVNVNSPLVDGGYSWKSIFKIKNVSNVLKPINYKTHFDKGAGISGTDEFPHLEINQPLDIESLEDDIFFDTYLYAKQGNNFKGSNVRFYMNGYSKYLVIDDSFEVKEVKVKTEKVEEQTKKWDKSGTKYIHAGYEKNGRIYADDGKIDQDGIDKEYFNFLLRGYNWRNQEELPRIFLSFSGKTEPTPEAPIKFKDVDKKSWYSNYVIKLVEMGGIKGFEDGTFRPDDKVKVGELLKMALSSATGEEYEASDDEYWAMGVYDEAIERGIIKEEDFPRTRESLRSDINREDAAYIVSNVDRIILNNEDLDTDDIEKKISDYEDIASNRKEAVKQVYKKEIMEGKGSRFDPKGSTKRSEASALIVRLLDK